MARYINADELIDTMERGRWHSAPVELIKSMPHAHVAPAPKWISVDERLPEESTNAQDRVLVVVKGAFSAGDLIDTDRIYNDRWVRWRNSVTHWMPLPEPPKEERHD